MKKDLDRDSLDFGNERIPRLFSQLFFPTLIGMVFNALLTIIDGVFVGQGVGANGIAAVNIVAPLFMVVTGLGLMFGIGSSVIASIHLANNKVKAANIISTQAFLVGIVIVVLISIPCLFAPQSVVRLLGCSDVLLPNAIDYLLWLLPGMTFLLIECVGMMLVRLDGSPRYAMWCNIVAATFNIALDYILVFPLQMGVAGAAIATSVSCALGGIMVLVYFIFYSNTLKFYRLKTSLTSLLLTLRNTWYMAKIGFATFLTEIAMSVMMLTGNYVFIGSLGENGVAAFSIACYLFPVIFSMSNAVAQSAQPIISYNYGAGNMSRVSKSLKTSLAAALVCGIIVAVIVALGAKPIIMMFLSPVSEAFAIASEGLPKFALCGIFFALNIAMIGYYQSLEQSTRATVFTLLRGIIFIVPLFLLLPQLIGTAGMWLAIPASELLTLIVIAADFAFCRANRVGGEH
ncbi:MATE family efflux transporter [uncultured Muribaculum sp.]|uniref:MATE family efflux transporter n=1 Tax=uncultured Muribaculum sp. TaxID=1918613 RepID=UPI002649A77D|nr:MATE family efflux transporter [uncultured Muribaculum sp.]